jgi:hypothetical protein
MPSTYKLISATTLSTTTTTVTFSAIPSTYTDLVLRIGSRDSFSNGNGVSIKLRFNSDTASNYSWTLLQGSGTFVSSSRASNQSGRTDFEASSDAGQTANTFGSTEIYIPSYTVSQNKAISGFGASENNNSTANRIGSSANLWRNTAAISQIDITTYQNFVSGSSFYLYGIKNS